MPAVVQFILIEVCQTGLLSKSANEKPTKLAGCKDSVCSRKKYPNCLDYNIEELFFPKEIRSGLKAFGMTIDSLAIFDGSE